MATAQGPFYLELGYRIGQARRRAGLTQEQLAAGIGLSRTSVANVERGRQPLQVHTLAQLAQILRSDLGSLVPPVAQDGEPDMQAQVEALRPDTQAWVQRILTSTEPDHEG